ncbi:MAG TPA: phosphotransferase family protein [Gemmatimonadaceae bacterium]|nr:phosphotransferase family protein [Gemmatimonadaceae bacterium]
MSAASREEVDIGALRAWMQASVPVLQVTTDTIVSAVRVGGGYSNLTFDVTLGDGDAAHHVILRRAPVGVKADRGAHDMRREFRVLRSVHGSPVPVPEPIALCEDESVIGGMFFLMSRVPGVAVRTLDDAPALRDPAVMRGMSEACIDALAALHALPVEGTPLFDAGRVDGYGARQVRNWHARWSAARTADVPDDDAAVVFAWMTERLPAPLPPTVLHNDWKFDNLLVDAANPSAINGVLDWEMSTVGDPRFDLATALGYWVQANDPPMLQALALGVTNAPGCLTRGEVVERYAAQRGVLVESPVFWYVFGLAKVAVIVLQLYARHASGQTRDRRFAALGGMATLLMQTARAALEHETLGPV